MILNAGKKVVYPNQGPCRIGAVVEKDIGGRPANFYPLAVMDDSGDVLFVPVNKVDDMGIRPLVKKSQIPKLLDRLSQKFEIVNLPNTRMNWKQRAADHSKLLASGSPLDLVTIIGTLTELNESKSLSPRDREVLDKARKNLICEIAEATGESKSAAEQQVNAALEATKRQRRSLQKRPGSDVRPISAA